MPSTSLLSRWWTCEWTIDSQREWLIEHAHVNSLPWVGNTPETMGWKSLATTYWTHLVNCRDPDYYIYVVLLFMTDTDHPVFDKMTHGDSPDKIKAFYEYLFERIMMFWQGLLPNGQPIVMAPASEHKPRVRSLVNDPIATRAVVQDIMHFYTLL